MTDAAEADTVETKEQQQEDSEQDAPFEPSFDRDIIELDHSYGYDCKRLFNMCLIDDDTLVFASGNYIHYFSISRQKVTFRKTQFDAGIGFITKNEHPDYLGLLTVAENGPKPTIFIYEFPSHDVRVRLEGAAKLQFTCGSYNLTGELFASQAGYPDFMLTIWRWENAEVILRAKSFQNDILHVHFSNFNPILLVSCGMSHIKFWKMANTFTGLKLKGDLGRFGKTDFSDIYAIYMLPDENVISGCEWGNMLLWEAGLIKFEICRKGRKPCHQKPITRISMDNGEVTTVGMDGYVRIWFWETVDLADPPDDDRFVEIEPIYEFQVGDCEIRGLQKIKPFDNDDTSYYAQDGGGGFWYCDLNKHDVPDDPRKLYSCHGGKVISIRSSPVSSHIITLGEDGKVFLYDYAERKLLLEKKFMSLGTDLYWFTTKVSNSGMELVGGFKDGILRQLLLDICNPDEVKLELSHAVKAHSAAITKITVNPRETVLVTGSEDCTIFIYNVIEAVDGLITLRPMGFVKLNTIPVSFNWVREKFQCLLTGCRTGEVYEYLLPARVFEEQTFLSYNIAEADRKKSYTFLSVKSQIRRDIKREQIKKRKEAKRQRKLDEVDKLKKANPGLQIDMESALADSEPEEEEPPLFIPPIPNPVLFLRHTAMQTIWLSMGGYDAGYIYEVVFTQIEPVRCTLIPNGDDCEMHSYLQIEDFVIFGLVNGKLRINHINPLDFKDLRDYRLFSMHDTQRGIIPQMVKSYDGKYIFTIGHDGNVFSFRWHGPEVPPGPLPSRDTPFPELPAQVIDITDPNYPSLEQEKINAERKRQEEAAAAHDQHVLDEIAKLQIQFDNIMEHMSTLPPDLQLPHREMQFDERITKQIADELQAELDDVRDDLAYDLEVAQVGQQKLYKYFLQELDHLPVTLKAIGTNVEVSSFRMNRLGEEYRQMLADIEERLKMEAARRGEEEKEEVEEIVEDTKDVPEPAEPTYGDDKSSSVHEPGIESFFFGRSPEPIIARFSRKMLRLLRRYRARQLYEIERIYNWEKLDRYKPDPNRNHPDDEAKIKEAKRTLGDYKMKIGYDYEPRVTENFTHKYIEIADCHEKLFNIRKKFNHKLFSLRAQKKELYEFIEIQRKRLSALHGLLPLENHLFLPDVPPVDNNEEYPELNLIEHFKPGCGIEIADILYLERNIKDLLPQPPKPIVEVETTFRDIVELEKHHALRIQEVTFVPDNDDLLDELNHLPANTESAYYDSSTENAPSPWLVETRYRWLLTLLDEQEKIIYLVNDRIQKFNASLVNLSASRLYSKFDVEFMSSYMTTLNQELVILRDSEQIENQLLSNADDAMRTRNQMHKTINVANRHIDDIRKMCDRLNEQITSVQLKFMTTIKGHKFFDFLRRIFKKKWRPPKAAKDNDESSESSSSDESSSEDEDDETKSMDSQDMTAIRLDESTCPNGLERSMYEFAFKMRADRHALEKALSEQQKLMEGRRLEVIELQKQMKHHEDVYAEEKENLLDFRRKRQQELNKVKVAVVLRMDQIQHFHPGENYRILKHAVLFDANRLASLKMRADQLQLETLETKRIFRVNIVHLRRMNTDIKFMRMEICRLDAAIKDEMMKKFGMVVNLDELEEEVLRKYIFDLETTAEDDMKVIEAEIKKKNCELAAMQDLLIRETQDNVNKLNVLDVLMEEKNFLDDILAEQNKNFEKWSKPPSLDLDRDIEKMLSIKRKQKERIECLEREICTLRMKAKPLQLDTEMSSKSPSTEKIKDDAEVNLDMFAADAYELRLIPDDYIMERVHNVVQRTLAQQLTSHASKDNIRKYATKLARYLGQAAYTFQGDITDRVLDCIIDNMHTLLPKKYHVYLPRTDLHNLFEEVLNILDYEHSDVNTEDLVNGICTNTIEGINAEGEPMLNKTQYIMEKLFKQLIEVLRPEEFCLSSTISALSFALDREPLVNPRCINIEKLINVVIDYARENLLEGVTSVPIRRMIEEIAKTLIQRKTNTLQKKCSVTSV